MLFLSGLLILSICLGMFAGFSAKFGKTGEASKFQATVTVPLSHDTNLFVSGWGKAGVAMVMIFIFFFGSTFNASPYAYAAEVLPTKIRANGMVIGLFSANALTVMFTQTAPIALEKITWRFSFIFVGCNFFFFPIAYFFFPEVCP
jgi:hypothetical protein